MITVVLRAEARRYSWGRILGRNWDKSLKSFPPCYSQSPLLTDFTPLEQKWFEAGLWYKNCVQKSQVWELSRLCPETLTKLYVQEFGFWFPFSRQRSAVRVVWSQGGEGVRHPVTASHPAQWFSSHPPFQVSHLCIVGLKQHAFWNNMQLSWENKQYKFSIIRPLELRQGVHSTSYRCLARFRDGTALLSSSTLLLPGN